MEARSEGGKALPAASLDYVPRQVAQALELDMGDGLIVYDHGSSMVHHLNPSAAIVWRLCDGEATLSELALDIAEGLGLDLPTVQAQVTGLVAQFDAVGLVGPAEGQQGHPARTAASQSAP